MAATMDVITEASTQIGPLELIISETKVKIHKTTARGHIGSDVMSQTGTIDLELGKDVAGTLVGTTGTKDKIKVLIMKQQVAH